MKIKDLGNGNYQTYPETDDMIEVEDIDKWVQEHRPKPSEEQIKRERIDELKMHLGSTDYQAIKHSEGLISDKDYEPVRQQREQWREEIRRLEKESRCIR